MGFKLKDKKGSSEEPKGKFTIDKMIEETRIYNPKLIQSLFDENKKEGLDGLLRHSLDYVLWTGNAVKHIREVVAVRGDFPKAHAVLEIFIIFRHVYGMPKEKAFESANHVYGHIQEEIDLYIEKSKDNDSDKAGTVAFSIAREVMKHIGIEVETTIETKDSTDEDLM